MSRVALLAVLLVSAGCASRKQAGDVLVVAGTAAVVVGATGGATYCNETNCFNASPSQKGRSAAIAGAGMAAVVAGSMLQESDRYDVVSRPRSGSEPAPEVVPATYRLAPRDPPEPPPAETESPETEAASE